MTIEIIFLSFIFYSFIGWLYESALVTYIQKRTFINRGFFLGPYCPIYGAGAVFCYLLLKDISNPIILFIMAAIVCCTLEYFTSYVMEKLFHARWWDYSNLPFNINGRVCLAGAIIFGAGAEAVCLWLQPHINNFLLGIKPLYLQIIAVIVFVLFVVDVVTTIIIWNDLNSHLSIIHNALADKSNQYLDDLADRLTNSINYIEKNRIRININDLNVEIKQRELRFFKSFPYMKLKGFDKLEYIQFKDKINNHIENIKKQKAYINDINDRRY